MLSVPEAGWTRFSTETRTHRLSYLTNVPIDWLNQAIHGLETLTPFTVCGFCEPMRFLCTVSYWNCHVIREDECDVVLDKAYTTWEPLHINMLEFCKQLHHDISSNIDAWADWYVGMSDDVKSNAQQHRLLKKQILKRLNHLEKLIRKNEDTFNHSVYFF